MAQELSLEETNDLTFSVAIEGTDDPNIRPQVRLVFERGDRSYGFKGNWDMEGEVNVTIPPMKGIFKEGTYQAHLEVIVADRYFKPLELPIRFKAPLKIVAEVKSKTHKISAKSSGPVATAVLSEVKSKKTSKKQLDEMDKLIRTL